MARGDVKAGRSPLIGNAGEYYVMAELLARGWVAGLTPRGAGGHDIIAKKGERMVEIRVKTKTADARIFRWNKRNGRVLPTVGPPDRDFCVLVDIEPAVSERDAFRPLFYVAPAADVEQKLESGFATWVSTPGKNGRVRSAESPMVFIDTTTDASWLRGCCGNWAALDGPSGT